ncbi:DUF4129 domain-containing protein [Blastopirellula marina]|uniref:Protein-glutamine gamma-glutamyltransferase-like C-terminal domain-containing protein n=1 Tax=Blastopirellula marina DSM 3645 TaxID=314230 RepID=A3ZTT7_9BACT|nr:DUF4129 domain-containing protein [Blastopirellula marina]EAQ79992.1 hypothetical protein DSM3645_05200 [Blastopirellula marina DSM 3645]
MNALRTSSRIAPLLLLGALVAVAAAEDWWDGTGPSGQLEEPVATTQKELAQLPSAPWYDAEKDALARVPVTPPASNDYRPAPPTPASAATNWSWWPDFSWLSSLFSSGIWSLGAIMIYTMVLVGLGVIGYLIFRYLENADLIDTGLTKKDRPEAVDTTTQVDRLESLPFQVKRPDSDLLAEARRCYDKGDYNEAIVYLFSYELVELDKRQIIRLGKGKTNGQYLREIRKNFALQDILEVTMRAFEDVFFGQRKLTQSGFERCWEQLEPFRQHLSGVVR